MSFIVIEGLDGSGKSTQVNLLKQHLESKNIDYEYVHFPRVEEGVFGELVAAFLRGELGGLNDVHPRLVALIYAGDRNDYAEKIKKWQAENKLILVDRYVCSNIAFQCAKEKNWDDKVKLAHWIMDLEYKHYGIPSPDLNLFLKVPFSFTEKKLTESREGDDRDYLKGKEDIHEASLQFQKDVKEMYLWQVENLDHFEAIDCSDSANNMLSPNEIFEKICKTLTLIPELA